jgi:hypothetical protein
MTDKKRPPKKRIDSVTSVHEAIVAGGKKINVPRDIRFTPKQRLIFTEICDEFSKSELTPHKIRLAAKLASDMAALEEAQTALADEGYVFVNSHGNPTASPRLRALQTLTSAVLSTRRSLGIHARELAGGDNRRAGIHRAHNKAHEQALSDDEDFARPNVVPFGRREQEAEDD